jgi:mRNA-degrading endonuclease RelE of RelBE toxin-antitoxin system
MRYKIEVVPPAQERLKRLKQPPQTERKNCKDKTFQSLLKGLMSQGERDRKGVDKCVSNRKIYEGKIIY